MPLHVHGLRTHLVLAELAATQDQLLAVLLLAPRDAALGRDTRLAHRVTSAVAAPFAAAQRVVDRVHRLRTGVRADAHVATATGFAEADVDPVEVAELADRRPARAADPPHFAGREDDDGPIAFLGAEASHSTGG